jgi:hypothetical protein
MKKLLLTLTIALFSSVYLNSQSISFTSTLAEAEIGSTVTINYEYTIPSDGNIYCAINLYDEFTWQSMVADGSLSPAPAGTNVTGSFQFTIPEGTTPTSDLTNLLNYKLVIELSDSSWNWLAGDYPATEINFAETLSNDEFLNNDSFSVFPNPASEFIEIEGLDITGVSNFTIFNTLGKKVSSSDSLLSNKVDVSNLNSGVYFISISNENRVQTLKFIKN